MTPKPKGGQRSGAGQTIVRIKISLERGRKLRSFLKARIGGEYSPEVVAAWVENQIDVACERFEAEIAQAAERAWEGEIL